MEKLRLQENFNESIKDIPHHMNVYTVAFTIICWKAHSKDSSNFTRKLRSSSSSKANAIQSFLYIYKQSSYSLKFEVWHFASYHVTLIITKMKDFF